MRTRSGVLFVTAFCIGVFGVVATTVIGANSFATPERPDNSPIKIDPVSNRIEINAGNEVLWNGRVVTLSELEETLEKTKSLPTEPELQFVPEPTASYELSAKVLTAIKDSRVTKFGFVGNEKYRTDGPRN